MPLAGWPMLQHVIDRMAPQADPLLLAVEQYDPALDSFGLRQVPDPLPGNRGPLGGVLSALRRSARSTPWLLLVPCDAPFLPPDLGAALQSRAGRTGSMLVTAAWRGEWQPTFSLWHRALIESLDEAVTSRQLGGLKQFMREVGAEVLDWPPSPASSGPDPFYNVNDPGSLQRAEGWLSQGTKPC